MSNLPKKTKLKRTKGKSKEKLETTLIEEELRKTGIAATSDVRWGTHFCHFYQTKEDLVDILVPYFKAGLEDNEFCMWVTSEPLSAEEAKKAMRKAVPHFDQYFRKGQIEIVPYIEWYLKDGAFSLQRVLNAWIDKLNQALTQGYDGMRVTGNTAWLEKKDWKKFADYEEEVNNTIGQYRMIAICTYSLEKCGVHKVIDVVNNHQFALIKREGEWELIESSKHKRAKELLQKSEERYRILTETSPDCIKLFDLKGNLLFINKSGLKEHGLKSLEEAIGSNWRILDTIVKEDRPKFKKAFEAATKGETVIIEIRHTPEKSNRDVCLETMVPVKDDKDNIVGIYGVSRNFTGRKKMEKILGGSEKKFRGVFESANECLVLLDRSGKILHVNERTAQVAGRPKEEVLGKHFTKLGFFSSKDIPKIIKAFADVLAGKDPRLEIQIKNKKGEEVDLECSANLLRAGTEVLGVIVVARDTTERKKAEKELHEREEKFREIFESINDGIVYVDKYGRIIDINKAVTGLFGYKRDEVVGKSFIKLGIFRLRDLPKIAGLFKEAIRKGKVPVSILELEIKDKNGKITPIEASTEVIKKNGQIIGTINILRDVTERKELEKQRLESNRRLQQTAQELMIARDELKVAIETKGEFMNIAAHELKTPLQPIIGYTDRLLQSSGPTDWQKERLTIVLDNARHLEKLVQDVLDINKMETGIMKFSIKRCDLLEVIKNIYESFRPAVEEKRLEFILDTPKTAGKIKVRGDAGRLTQVFSNLINNAIKFTDKGTITLQLKEDKDVVTVNVKDTGIGISKKDLPKLFTKFFQADISDERRCGGTGLGLAICKEIIKAHNGEVSAQSTLGKGSTFRVVLPKLTKQPQRKGVKRWPKS